MTQQSVPVLVTNVALRTLIGRRLVEETLELGVEMRQDVAFVGRNIVIVFITNTTGKFQLGFGVQIFRIFEMQIFRRFEVVIYGIIFFGFLYF